jgi:hypothetical protein
MPAILRGEFHPDVDEFRFIVHVEFGGNENVEMTRTYSREDWAIREFEFAKRVGTITHACIIIQAFRITFEPDENGELKKVMDWEFIPEDWKFRREGTYHIQVIPNPNS